MSTFEELKTLTLALAIVNLILHGMYIISDRGTKPQVAKLIMMIILSLIGVHIYRYGILYLETGTMEFPYPLIVYPLNLLLATAWAVASRIKVYVSYQGYIGGFWYLDELGLKEIPKIGQRIMIPGSENIYKVTSIQEISVSGNTIPYIRVSA